MSNIKVFPDSTVPASVAGNNYSELRAQLGDQVSTFYGPHGCSGCGELIVKRAIEQGGEAFTFPKLPGDKYEPHICDPASSKADHIAPAAATQAAIGDLPPIKDHPFVRSVRALLDHMRSEPKHSLLATLLSDCEREYKNLFD